MIPKIIHHIAPEDTSMWHPVWDACYPTWLEHFPKPEYIHIMWNDLDMIDELVANEFPQYWSIYKDLRHIMKIDVAKMIIIYMHGGLYTDMDYYCYENFYEDFEKDVVLTGSIHYGELVQNGFVAAAPHHPFIRNHIDDMFNRCKVVEDTNDDEYVKECTGPGALTRAYYGEEAMHWDIQILDPKRYNPEVELFYDEEKMKKVKCIHLLSGIWGRNDLVDKEWMGNNYEGWRGVKISSLKNS